MRLTAETTVKISLLFNFLLSCTLSFEQQRGSKGIDSILYHRDINSPFNTPHKSFIPLSKIQSSGRVIPELLRSTEVKTTCADTSSRLLYLEDSLGIANSWITQTADGNILIPGWRLRSFTPYRISDQVIKCTPKGEILWTKRFDGGTPTTTFVLYKAFELADKSILVAGNIEVPMPVNGREEMMLIKLTAAGDLLWQKTFKSSVWNSDTTVGSIDINDAKSMANGDILLCGAIRHFGAPREALMARITATGNPVWSKGVYFTNSSPQAFGLNLVDNNHVQVFGLENSENIFCLTINPSNGDTLSCKKWRATGTDAYWRSIYVRGLVRLNNGNLTLFGGCNGDMFPNAQGYYWHSGMLELTPDLKIVKSYLLRSALASNYYNTRFTVYPDASAAFSRFRYTDNTYTSSKVLFGKVINEQVIKERVIHYSNNTPSWISNFIQLPDGGDFVAQSLVTGNRAVSGIEIFRLHNSDKTSDCLGKDQTITSVEQQQYEEITPFAYLDFDSILSETSRPLATYVEDGLNVNKQCEQKTFCNLLKLLPSDTILCPSTPLFITIRKNSECGSKVAWQYDTIGVQSFEYINDTTLQVKFRSLWEGTISGSISSCMPFNDSVHIRVLATPAGLSLGADTTLCRNNTILLNAHSGFASYLWQDGSADSTLKITQPGTYTVATTDACGGVYKDTIVVKTALPIPFSLGSGLIKCNSDSITITAPAGFISYSWSPAYNISSATTQKVTVYPDADIIYSVKAEKTPGCFAYDSLRVKVYHSPAIDLGRDQSFCKSDSLLLDAGNNFYSYLWNSGATTQSITVKEKGIYSIIGTSEEGCKSYDTLTVLHVYNNPEIQLNKDSLLCTGINKVLDAGSGYNSYLWKNGSNTRTITINNTGTYWVSVVDKNGCKGSDTTSITKLLPLPAHFLPKDTTVCSYGSLLLQPLESYSSYLWSIGDRTHTITIKQPGNYWLEVLDNNGCIGRDSITIGLKQCMEGFYIPNAFTPNNDGKNDVFKPLLFGNVVNYTFTIYNRWGEKIFESKEPGKGWDGKTKAMEDKTSSYVWICTYQLAGAATKAEKGTVTLIK